MAEGWTIRRQVFTKTAWLILLAALVIGPALVWSSEIETVMVMSLILDNAVSLTSNILFILLMNYQLGRLLGIRTFLIIRIGSRQYDRLVLQTLLLDWLIYTVSLYTIESLVYGWTHIELRYVWLFFVVNALMYLLLVAVMALTLRGLSVIVAVITAIFIELAFHYLLIVPVLPYFVQEFTPARK